MSHRGPFVKVTHGTNPDSPGDLVFAKLLPLIALAAALFGMIFIYVGWHSYAGGAPGWGVAIGLFGLLGVAMAIALVRLGLRLRKAAGPKR
jgi:ABC-type Na+ efflux pump permease subunit